MLQVDGEEADDGRGQPNADASAAIIRGGNLRHGTAGPNSGSNGYGASSGGTTSSGGLDKRSSLHGTSTQDQALPKDSQQHVPAVSIVLVERQLRQCI